MITENLSTLKIHKLTQEQYDRELANGNLDDTALYLTPDEEIDLSQYATVEQLNEKADASHIHDDRYYTEAEVDALIAGKANASHNHNDVYYTKAEIDNFELITINDIDAICGGALVNMITFTIDGTEHQAEEGMTWAEWCDSGYNNIGLQYTEDSLYLDDSSTLLESPNDTITADANYETWIA